MDEISVVRGGRKHLALRVEIWQVLVACVMLLLGDVFFFARNMIVLCLVTPYVIFTCELQQRHWVGFLLVFLFFSYSI